MCGIAGVAGALDAVAASAAVERMCEAQAHRGPDDSGVVALPMQRGALVLGHRRLSIIDTSSSAHQPMSSVDGKMWIAFNGEIYNFRDLRNSLELLGHTFHTASDTEVLLAAFAEWGVAVLPRLRGIFSFAVADLRGARPRLTLARDHMGVKPLYYVMRGGALAFASEVRALLASELVPRRLCVDGLQSYLSYGSVQEPFSLVDGVRSLPRGHVLTWDESDLRIEQYWSPSAPSAETGGDTDEELGVVLERAVTRQLVADVPLGIFLSGGIDSSAIAAFAKRRANAPLHTVAVVFDDQEYDERQFSRSVAARLGTHHQEVHLSVGETLETLPEALAAFDQPSVDGLNTFTVSRAAREAGLTVALSGLGGDELFAGYRGFAKQRKAERWRGLARALSVLPQPAVGALSSLAAWRGPEALRKVADLVADADHPYFATRRVFSRRQVGDLFDGVPTSWEMESFGELKRLGPRYDTINRISLYEMSTYMLSTLLRDADQMSMASGLELRVPLLDVDVVTAALRIPGQMKIVSGTPKPLLTRTVEHDLPAESIYRPKRGFDFPFASWLRGSLGKAVRSTLFDFDPAQIPLHPDRVRSVWLQFEAGRVAWSRPWSLFVLISWMQRHGVGVD